MVLDIRSYPSIARKNALMWSINKHIRLSAYGIYGTSSPDGIITYKVIPVLDRWLADDAQVLLSSSQADVPSGTDVQMFIYTDVKCVELVVSWLDSSGSADIWC